MLGLRGCLACTSCNFRDPRICPPVTYVSAGALFSLLLVAELLTNGLATPLEAGCWEVLAAFRLLWLLLGLAEGVCVAELDRLLARRDMLACEQNPSVRSLTASAPA